LDCRYSSGLSISSFGATPNGGANTAPPAFLAPGQSCFTGFISHHLCPRIGQTRDRNGTIIPANPTRLLAAETLGFAGPQAEANVHIWLEPAAVLLCAATLRYVFAEQHLSAWLVFVAACIFAKESLNYWTARRRGNIAEDIKEEAEDRGEALGGGQPSPKAPKAARVAEPAMKRNVVLTREEERAIRLAKILGLTEPYDLDEAEANYRERIQLTHPDTHGNSAESNKGARN
jgi:hypothetical protein